MILLICKYSSIIQISFLQRKSLKKEDILMTYADLVWHLIESLQQKQRELNQANEIIRKYKLTVECLKQNEAK